MDVRLGGNQTVPTHQIQVAKWHGSGSRSQPNLGQKSNSPPVPPTSLDKHLEALNRDIRHTSLSVEFDTSHGAGKDWLNIVNTQTGEVVYKIPAENIRKLVESGLSTTSLGVTHSL